jgi:hypothetical protein
MAENHLKSTGSSISIESLSLMVYWFQALQFNFKVDFKLFATEQNVNSITFIYKSINQSSNQCCTKIGETAISPSRISILMIKFINSFMVK